jgi:3-oxoacyl-[acyl-carrier protein] reductase
MSRRKAKGKLENRLAVVTGAASGIGKGIALTYAEEGANVVVIDKNAEGAARTASAVAERGRVGMPVGIDVSDEAAVDKAFSMITNSFGAPDILVNNAGICTVSLLEEMSTAMWDEMIRINLKSVFLCTRAVLPVMRRKRYGRIINISSQLAHKGAAGMAHYAAAKAGILGLTRSLSYEVAADNIVVNAICPGPIDTPMKLPPEWASRKQAELVVNRQGRVEEITPTALLLACEEAGFYIGATFNPNGGDIMV